LDAPSSDYGVDDMHELIHFALAAVVAIITALVVAFIFLMNADTDSTVSEVGKTRAFWASLTGFVIAVILLKT
jgi:hypothetical protein